MTIRNRSRWYRVAVTDRRCDLLPALLRTGLSVCCDLVRSPCKFIVPYDMQKPRGKIAGAEMPQPYLLRQKVCLADELSQIAGFREVSVRRPAEIEAVRLSDIAYRIFSFVTLVPMVGALDP